ncbi:nucleolar protein 12 [Geosmithia morbida]|uniref:Nucleolar protein 12 n=1 Tax=Geosmithia morbida TaxID=1094350 RepID=A0A9P4YYF7_9HYPO|nr:nucleolar protein 12 [Geosmithia morbida]KAF4124089.1 nucleolar protein 12 [Geosmithia morbida]
MTKKSTKLAAAASAVDPTLDALFSTSAGPVQAPPRERYLEPKSREERPKHETEGDSERDEDSNNDDDDEALSEASGELDYDDGDDDQEIADEADEPTSAEEEEGEQEKPKKGRKRKRKDDDNAELEDRYMTRLSKEEDPEGAKRSEKRLRKAGGDGEDSQDEDASGPPPKHESLTDESKTAELEKADRTAFIANINSSAVSSKADKKALLAHLSSVLDAKAGEKIESMRFRSVAFSTGSMPKKAAYITKQIMEATTRSTNAYVVYPTAASVRRAAAELNGTEVLGRHIRVDSVSHPSPTDHRRCIFVGNLGFVDDESILEDTEDGKTVKKKRNKVPSDVEEGLWRTFSKEGKVENVRVVRDPHTRVGKGFAYVQFYDGNSVESALLQDGKKFPPMLPRALRVTRAKDPRKTNMAIERQRDKLNSRRADSQSKSTKYKQKFTPEEMSQAGRASKLLGRAGAAQQQHQRRPYNSNNNNNRGRHHHRSNDRNGAGADVDMSNIKTPQEIVFEGTRASSIKSARRQKDFKMAKKQKGKGGPGGRPAGRSSRRAAEWKKTKKD